MNEDEELTDWEKQVKAIVVGLQNDHNQMIKDFGTIKLDLETIRRQLKEIIVRLKVIAEALE